MNNLKQSIPSFVVSLLMSTGVIAQTSKDIQSVIIPPESNVCPASTRLVFPKGDQRLTSYRNFTTCTDPLEISFTDDPRIVKIKTGAGTSYHYAEITSSGGLEFLGQNLKEAKRTLTKNPLNK